MSSLIYDKWKNICNHIVDNKLTDWKRLPDVTTMLEHLSYENGKVYLSNLIEDGVNPQIIQKLCSLNDQHGNANIQEFENNILSSPSSIRYFRHALDICNLIKSKNYTKVNIIEIGGGYGGLCIILNQLSVIMGINIDKYFIYDLPETQKLQRYYLSNANNVRWKPANTFGKNFITNDGEINILVSCYCLSEIEDKYKLEYLQNLLHKVHGAYLSWNWGDKTGLPIDRIETPEYPDTGNGNTIIKW
jgi:hypothetical protein